MTSATFSSLSPVGTSLADPLKETSPTTTTEMSNSISFSSILTLKPSPRSSVSYVAGISSPSLVSVPSLDSDDDLLLLTPSELHMPSETLTCDDSCSTTGFRLRKRSIDSDSMWNASFAISRDLQSNDPTQGHKRARKNNAFVLPMRRSRRFDIDSFREVTGSTLTLKPTAPYDNSIGMGKSNANSVDVLSTPRNQSICFSDGPPAVRRVAEEEPPLPRCHSGILLPLLL